MDARAKAAAGGILLATAGAVALPAVVGGAEGGIRNDLTETRPAVEARLDSHAARPAAASTSPDTASPLVELQTPADERAIAFRADHERQALRVLAWVTAVKQAEYTLWLTTIAENQVAAAAHAARRHPATRVASRPVTVAASTTGSGNLDCVRRRESHGDYGAVNRSSGAAGAYQFLPGTWNSNARDAGRADLVGVNPAQASPADQDAMAAHLMATQGMAPWGGACR